MPCNITLWGDESNRVSVLNELSRYGFRQAESMNRSSNYYESNINLEAVGGPHTMAPMKVPASVVSPIFYLYFTLCGKIIIIIMYKFIIYQQFAYRSDIQILCHSEFLL